MDPLRYHVATKAEIVFSKTAIFTRCAIFIPAAATLSVAANGKLFVRSGYVMFGQAPGNVLLAFRPKEGGETGL